MNLLEDPQLQGNQKHIKTEERSKCKRTQTDHSRRESLMSSSSQEPRASGKPNALFSSRSDELGNQFEKFMFKFADPSNLGRSLLEGNEDHLFSQARSELLKQEHQVGSLKNCIGELQQQASAQILEFQDAQHGFFEPRREQVRPQEELIIYEGKFSEILKIRNLHEMGEIQRAQEHRVDEVSVQKLRENHETTQNLTSQLQEIARTDEFNERFK